MKEIEILLNDSEAGVPEVTKAAVATLIPRLLPSPSLNLPLHEGFTHVLTFYNPLYHM
jgi:hypothetical protein